MWRCEYRALCYRTREFSSCPQCNASSSPIDRLVGRRGCGMRVHHRGLQPPCRLSTTCFIRRGLESERDRNSPAFHRCYVLSPSQRNPPLPHCPPLPSPPLLPAPPSHFLTLPLQPASSMRYTGIIAIACVKLAIEQ